MNNIPPQNAQVCNYRTKHQTTLTQTQKQILGVLDNNSHYREKHQLLGTLIESLIEKIDEMNKASTYPYEMGEYRERLSTKSETVQDFFEINILKNPQLAPLLKHINECISDPTTQKQFEDRLWKEYFEDLTYESMPKGFPVDLENISVGSILRKEVPFESLNGITRINLNEFDFQSLDPQTVSNIFSNLKHLRTLNFRRTCLVTDSFELTESIFGSFEELKDIDLWGSNLLFCDPPTLKYIFSKISSIKSLILGSCQIPSMTESQFDSIFSQLPQLRYLDLSWNNFRSLTDQQIEIIFSNLPHLKSIDLNAVSIKTLDHKRIEKIFGSLGKIVNIDLSNNVLHDLDDSKLDLIWGSLTQAKIIKLDAGAKSKRESWIHKYPYLENSLTFEQ